MSVLEQERIAIENIPGLRNTTVAQFAEFLASLSQETHRIPDPYSYSITTEGELFSSIGGCLVKDTIDDKTSPLGKLEYQAVIASEQWATSNDEGVLVWISPPKLGVYPTSKIIIQEIEYEEGVKKIFNRAVVLEFNEEQCMQFAWKMTNFSRNKPIFQSSDQIRAIPLILDTRNSSWIDILAKLIDTPKVWTMIRNGEDKLYKKEALRRAAMVQKQFFADPQASYSQEAQRAVVQMIGPHSGSCPPKTSVGNKTGLQVFSENSFTYTGSGISSKDADFCKSCPICEEEINCIVKVGGSCPKCGAVKRCG